MSEADEISSCGNKIDIQLPESVFFEIFDVGWTSVKVIFVT